MVVLLGMSVNACRYPDTMYTEGNKHFHIYSKDPTVTDEHYFQQVEAQGAMLTMSAMKYNQGYKVKDILTYECLAKEGTSKYIVKRIKHEDKDKFTCIEFVERSKSVIQWKIGRLVDKRKSVRCQDSFLQLWDAPLVNRKRAQLIETWYDKKKMKTDFNICPLTGGYNLEWYNATKDMYMCTNSMPPYKYEHNCILAEGVLFHSSETFADKCPTPTTSKGYQVKQKYSCLGYWEDILYQYMLLDSENKPDEYKIHKLPCVRVPKYRGASFEIYFFADGICDSTIDISESKDYVKMRLTMYKVEGVCDDYSPACQSAACDYYGAVTCRNKCNACKNGAYEEMDFGDEFQGKWLRQVDRVADDFININGSRLSFPAMGEFINIGNTTNTCMKGFFTTYEIGFFDQKAGYHNAIEYLALLDPTTRQGCSTHAVSISMVNRSDSVLSFKISKSRMQRTLREYEGSQSFIRKDSSSMCYETKYEEDEAPLHDTYHKDASGWYNLVRVDPPPTTVACQMPTIMSKHNKIKLNLMSGVLCSGSLTKTGKGSLEFFFDHCETQPNSTTDFQFNLHTKYRMDCLANFRVKLTEKSFLNFAIAQSADLQTGLQHNYVCWMFGDSHDVVSWYPISMCDTKSRTNSNWPLRYALPVANLTITSTNGGHSITRLDLPFKVLFTFLILFSVNTQLTTQE